MTESQPSEIVWPDPGQAEDLVVRSPEDKIVERLAANFSPLTGAILQIAQDKAFEKLVEEFVGDESLSNDRVVPPTFKDSTS